MIQLGHFLPGGTPLVDGKGVNETYIGMIEVGPQRLRAYVKLMPDRQLVNELLASVLGRLVGLPVPRGFLVLVQRSDYPSSSYLLQNGFDAASAFAVEELPHRALDRRADLASAEARKALLCAWSKWPEAACFDDWIANADRHPGNLLVGGPGEVWLIDHSHAFTGDKWPRPDLCPI